MDDSQKENVKTEAEIEAEKVRLQKVADDAKAEQEKVGVGEEKKA